MRQSLLNNTPLVVDKLFEGVHQGEFNQWQVFFFSSIEMRGPTLRNSFPLVKSQVFFSLLVNEWEKRECFTRPNYEIISQHFLRFSFFTAVASF
jgi:hypothetical protein